MVTIVWIDSVRSLAYQAAKMAARAIEKTITVVRRATPWLSTRLSVIWVPTTLISTTAIQ